MTSPNNYFTRKINVLHFIRFLRTMFWMKYLKRTAVHFSEKDNFEPLILVIRYMLNKTRLNQIQKKKFKTFNLF